LRKLVAIAEGEKAAAATGSLTGNSVLVYRFITEDLFYF
jgi:hypothetical protein